MKGMVLLRIGHSPFPGARDRPWVQVLLYPRQPSEEAAGPGHQDTMLDTEGQSEIELNQAAKPAIMEEDWSIQLLP